MDGEYAAATAREAAASTTAFVIAPRLVGWVSDFGGQFHILGTDF